MDIWLGRSRSGNPDPKKIRANLIRNSRHNSPSVRQLTSNPKKIRAEFIWFSRHKIGRRQQAILEREFGLNYGLLPFEVRRAPRLKGSFEVLTKVLLNVLFYITRGGRSHTGFGNIFF